MNVGDWLSRLGLGQYEQAFRDNNVDADVLPELTAEDLTDLGVTSVGHRRKLLAALAALREDAAPIKESAALAAPAANELPQYQTLSGAERRQLTVMFCDLVGSTALSARLDPEDLREVIAAYHRSVTEIVVESGGFIARYMGDGVLAYFGYPQAHEDDAERAVRAGLGAIDAVARTDVKSLKLQARVGIATGLVVAGELIGEGASQEQSVVGETPNLVARLQGLAEPNAVVIAEATRRLVGALFEYRDLGGVEVKGIPEPVQAWQVLRLSSVANRFEALRGAALTRLVGRDEEIDLLLRRWARAKAGDAQIVLVSGEAGIGKSRIVAALIDRVQAEAGFCLRHFCSPYHQDSPLFPFVEQLRRAAGFADDDSPELKLAKLEALATRAEPPEGDIALLADLLSLPGSDRHPLPNLPPRRKKGRTLEALIRQLEWLARQRPLLMVFEDAHWIDPTSRELLDLTVERVRPLSMLLVVTSRPEFQASWIGQPRVSALTLNRLDRPDRTALVLQVTDGKALPAEVVEQIVDRTDGVPLFVEELTKSVLESGFLREEDHRYVLDRALPPFAIPTSLHDSLMARLDRLGSVRHVAQIGAAIGREFSYVLLRAVSRLPENELEAALARLVASELVFQHGAAPDAVYAFKHALVQDAAHASLLRGPRQQLHAKIADALETQNPDLLDVQPELFAQHYAEAGLLDKSVEYWWKAGRRSAARSAMAEAMLQLQKGLDRLALLPETPETQRQELEFWNALGAALIVVKGNIAPETGYACARARELWERIGSPSEFLHIPHTQSRYHAVRGELDVARRLDEELLRLSRQCNESAGLVLGHVGSGRTLMLIGSFRLSRFHLEQVHAVYDPLAHRSLTHAAGLDPHVTAEAYLGLTLLCLGFPVQALGKSSAAIAEARKLAHPPSLALSLGLGTIMLALFGDKPALEERADQLVTVAAEQGFPTWGSHGTMHQGWLKVERGQVAEGISLLRNTVEARKADGERMWLPHYLALLARACEIAEEREAALRVLDETLQLAETTGVRWLAAEFTRHKGEMLLRQGDCAAAEELYRKALVIAAEQDAKFWELRAAMSLARLLSDQNRRSEAQDSLAPVYGWFTEGCDTPDLQHAKALLSELS
ncbi:MAG TPA: AAA family ATPase [Stellaceae bacterium]|nr:AAA family ATPase [Stellaceae bacterium]